MVKKGENASGEGEGGNAGDPGQSGGGEDIKAVLQKMTTLEEVIKKQDAKYEELKETHNKTAAMLEAAMNGEGNGGGRAPAGGGRNEGVRLSRDFATLYNIPNEAVDAIADEAVQRVQRTNSEISRMNESRAALQTKFYKENPDLVEHKPIVAYFANEVQQLHPNMTLKEGFEEAAKRSREYIATKLSPGGGNEPPEVLPGGKSRDGAGKGGGKKDDDDERMPTPDEELADELEVRRKAMARGQPQS